MLNHTKQIKEMYEEIQRKLLYMIPEKWESIYLYSSVIEKGKEEPTGELFFYYIPKGIFRKNPVNVYEVPSKFNIDENQYLELAQKLYDDIKRLREEFKKTTSKKMWSNLTISITNMKFRAEYSYEDLLNNTFNSYERHVIWRYKYLGIGPEQVSKKDKDILYRYFNDAKNLEEVEQYNAGIYIEQDTKNIFEYNTQEDEFENDGYITEEEMQEIGLGKKYNQIQSHKIENNWDANVRKKEKTIWSQDNQSVEHYIRKSDKKLKNNHNDKNNNEEEKMENKKEVILRNKQSKKVNKEQQNNAIEKVERLQEERQSKKMKQIEDKKPKEKKQKVGRTLSSRKNRKAKNEIANEEVHKSIRNQILFSEDEVDEE